MRTWVQAHSMYAGPFSAQLIEATLAGEGSPCCLLTVLNSSLTPVQLERHLNIVYNKEEEERMLEEEGVGGDDGDGDGDEQ